MSKRLLQSLSVLAGAFAVRSFLRGDTRAGAHGVSAAWAIWHLPGILQNFSCGLPVMTEFQTREREIWLTIDDGPTPEDTEKILRVLEKHHARASFFLIGKRVERHPGLAEKIVRAGHGAENHGWAHRSGSMWMEPCEIVRADMERASHAIRCATGKEPVFFRAPAGRVGFAMVEEAERLGLRVVGWSAKGGDGTCCGALWDAMNKVRRQVRPGAILVVHQGGRKGRAEALDYLLYHLGKGGWRTVLPGRGCF